MSIRNEGGRPSSASEVFRQPTLRRGVIALVFTFVLAASLLISLSGAPVASAAPGSSYARWSIPASPNVSSSFNEFTAVSCVGPSFCVSVGNATGSGRSNSLIESWNGGSWSVVPSPDPADQSAVLLAGVSCSTVAFCVAVGGGADGTFIESWNGSTWSVVPSPPGEASLSSVSCVNATFCMAVGSTPSPAFASLAEEWNGSTWSVTSSPANPPGVDQVSLNSVSCSSTTFCASVGSEDLPEPVGFETMSMAETWNGKVWTFALTPSPTSSTYLYGVSCPVSSWCMAVGFSGNSTLTERWNGTGWSVLPSPNSGSGVQDNLLAVSCTGTAFCSAVGYQNSHAFETFGESWNGLGWSIVPTPNPISAYDSFLSGVSCTAPQLCTAGGRWYAVNPNNPNQATTPYETLIETTTGQVLGGPVVGIATDAVTGGYQVVAADGGLETFNAPYAGALGGVALNRPVVGLADTPDGEGYWLVASDGGVFSFGDAQFYGSTRAIRLNEPIVGMRTAPDGRGYWLVASDGGVFSFGDAQFYGSTGSMRLNQPIVGMSATADGKGYWVVASDGGVFSFGDAPFYGSSA